MGIIEKNVLFSLTPHPLQEKLCDQLNLEPGSLQVRRFPDGESYLRVLTSVKGANCVILADLTHPDTKYLALLFLFETLRELGARSIGLVAPYLWSEAKAQRAAYRAALDRFSAAGHVRSRGEPRELFARRVGDVAPSFVPLTNVHVGAALGSRAPEAAGLGRSPRSLSTDVGREVRQSTPWWRWVIGALNPISWWWSR